MDLFAEVISLRPGSPELETIRAAVIRGDSSAAKKYVYFAAYQKLCENKNISPKKRLRAFKQLVDADMIRVSVEVNG